MSDMGASSGARRRRGSPRPCRDRNRHQNSHAQSRSVRPLDGTSQGDQCRSVGSLDGKNRRGTRSSSIRQIRRKLRQAIPSPMGYPNPSPMDNTGHTRGNTLENNKDSLASERGWLAAIGADRPDRPLPMVLLVHGGPWARDVWGYDGLHQMLANRGYAALSVNFRGSTGFGKSF